VLGWRRSVGKHHVVWRKMADPNKSKALYSSLVAFLGFACFALAATAIGLPLWGYYENPQGEFGARWGELIRSICCVNAPI